MSIQTKTWPYGTTRTAVVLQGPKPMTIARAGCQWVEDDQGEGHILCNGAEDKSAKIGDTGILTFTEGGPTGGYWKFVKHKCQRCHDTGTEQNADKAGTAYTCECEKGVELMNRYDLERVDREEESE